jgi:signal transduction histidine kinase
MARRSGLGKRLGRAFALQALAIGVTAIVSVWAAAFTIEEVLIEQALAQEAAYYWEARAARADFPVPDTLNLTGYLAPGGDDGAFPSPLRALPPGYHRLSSAADLTVVYVEERDGDRLALVFDGEQVRELSFYFGLVPLGLLLTALYLAAWLAYRAARRAVSPVEWLAREVHRLDPEHPDANAFAAERLPGNPDTEVVDLSDALGRLARRVNEFLERERNFTRDASHELRSPLTVIRLAADMLLSEQELTRPARNSVRRIKRAADDMEELTEAFLLLARESERGLSLEPVWVNDVVAEEVDRVRALAGERALELRLEEDCRMQLVTSDKVLSVMLGNLLRNAVNYTEEGQVVAQVGDGFVAIADSGPGIPREEVHEVFRPFFRGGAGSARRGTTTAIPPPVDTAAQRPAATAAPGRRPRGGHGVGLTIVKRFSDRFGWPVRIDSTPGLGTRVVVEFPDAEVHRLVAD